MKLFRSRFIRIAVLAVFVGFHAAQMLHTHKAVVGKEECSVCQVVHNTPGVDASASSAFPAVFASQSLLKIGGRIVVADLVSDSSRPRAPPAA